MSRAAQMTGLLVGLGLALLSACGGGAGGASVDFDPAETTPTRLVSADGAITVLIPTDALSGAVKLTLTNRSGGDAGVPGPEGRTLVMAMELTGTTLPTPPSGTGAGTGAGSQPTPAALSGTVDVTFSLPFTLRSDIGMPVYAFNSASARYEAAGVSGAIVVEGTATRSNQLKFSIGAFGRYAVYSLKPEELPPATPDGLKLLAASTQVRRLGWNAVSGPLIAGYNLYRADADTESFSKVNTDALAVLAYSDELSSAGGCRYRVTSVNTAGVESDPSAVVESPAVDFDVAFTFGAGTLNTPLALALDASRNRLVIADAGLKRLEVYDLSGVHQSTLAQYPGGVAMNHAAWPTTPTGASCTLSMARGRSAGFSIPTGTPPAPSARRARTPASSRRRGQSPWPGTKCSSPTLARARCRPSRRWAST